MDVLSLRGPLVLALGLSACLQTAPLPDFSTGPDTSEPEEDAPLVVDDVAEPGPDVAEPADVADTVDPVDVVADTVDPVDVVDAADAEPEVAPDTSLDCPPGAPLGCYNDAVFCLDPSGDPLKLVELCPGGQRCVPISEHVAECQCIPSDTVACAADGHVHRYDSCGVDEGVVESCPPPASACEDARCFCPDPRLDLASGCTTCTPGFVGDACDVCVRHVDAGVTSPVQDGLSWATAYPGLHAANDAAPAGCEIWARAGVYEPWVETYYALNLLDGRALRGGFAGDEVDAAAADPLAHPTVLMAEPPAPTHVTIWLGDDALLSGFHVLGLGGPAVPVRADAGSSTVRDCTFTGHHGEASGALGAYGTGVHLTVERCVFALNLAASITIAESTAVLRDVVFIGNDTGAGAAISAAQGASVTCTNCLVAGNRSTAEWKPAAVYSGGGGTSIDLRHATFIENTSLDLSAYGGSITAVNTLFVDGPDDDEAEPIYGTIEYDHCFVTTDVEATNSQTGFDPKLGAYPFPAFNSKWQSAVWHPELGRTALTPEEPPPTDLVHHAIKTSGDVRWTWIVATDATTLWVPGNVATQILLGTSFVVYDLRPAAGSPCIDAAHADFSPEADLTGQPRADDPDAQDTGTGGAPWADLGALERTP